MQERLELLRIASTIMTRANRAEDLDALRACDPERLLQLYWAATNAPPTTQLPVGISFSKMIDAILAREMADGMIDNDHRKEG